MMLLAACLFAATSGWLLGRGSLVPGGVGFVLWWVCWIQAGVPWRWLGYIVYVLAAATQGNQ